MKIILNERQEEILKNETIKEAVGFGFSIEYMKNIKSLKGRYEYCKQFLGNPVGRGSSRVVFQYDDNIVIKLALNGKGIAQNEAEYYKLCDSLLDVFPKVYNDFSDIDNFKFITTEYVLPATDSDFEHCLGVDFNTYCDVIGTWMKWAKGGRFELPYYIHELSAEEIEEITSYGNWENLEWYFQNYNVEGFGDLIRIANYGMTNRNGNPEIVILDSGLTLDVWEKHYNPWKKVYNENSNFVNNDLRFLKEGIKIHKGETGKRKSTQGRWEDEIDCPHCGESKAFFSMSISDGDKGRGRIKVTDEQGKEIDTEVQTIALYYCPKCYKFTALNNMA